MKLRLPSILADEEELDDRAFEPNAKPEPQTRPLHWAWTAAVALLAAVPRLLFIFVFSDKENPGDGVYTDVWHHWQIAYLTKEIGLSAPGGPRLWDLKGLDYFWGVLHPVLMVVAFEVTGSIDIVLDRLVSAGFGVAAVVLLFHICRQLWDTRTGVAAALVASLLPTSIMNDSSGMLEPLGIALCLFGIWAWGRRKGLQSGVAFGLASMARAEAWLFGLGMVIAAHFGPDRSRRRGPLVIGFAAVVGLYMSLLLNRTGNPIYPLWWNFLANALGKWEVPVTSYQLSVRPVLGVLLLVAAAGLAWSLIRVPRAHMLLVYGFGSWVFVTGLTGFTSYLADWSWWTPIGRHFEFPYMFVGTLLAAGLVWWLPRRLGPQLAPFGWAGLVAGILAAQVLWVPIAGAFGPTEATWQSALAEGTSLARWYDLTPTAGHSLALPPDRPDITYVLARFGGVEGKHMVSEMYDPFAYLPAGYAYAAHRETVDTLMRCWLASTDVRMIAVPDSDPQLASFVASNPSWFTRVGFMEEAKWDVEAVVAPRPAEAECQAARAAVR